MILEVSIGNHVAVSFDDEMVDQRPTPEQVEDYLTRMRRTAMAMWAGTTDEIVPALTEDDGS